MSKESRLLFGGQSFLEVLPQLEPLGVKTLNSSLPANWIYYTKNIPISIESISRVKGVTQYDLRVSIPQILYNEGHENGCGSYIIQRSYQEFVELLGILEENVNSVLKLSFPDIMEDPMLELADDDILSGDLLEKASLELTMHINDIQELRTLPAAENIIVEMLYYFLDNEGVLPLRFLNKVDGVVAQVVNTVEHINSMQTKLSEHVATSKNLAQGMDECMIRLSRLYKM